MVRPSARLAAHHPLRQPPAYGILQPARPGGPGGGGPDRWCRQLASAARGDGARQRLSDHRGQRHRRGGFHRHTTRGDDRAGIGTRTASRRCRTGARGHRRIGGGAGGTRAGSELAGGLAPLQACRGRLRRRGGRRIAADRARGPRPSGAAGDPDRAGPRCARCRGGASVGGPSGGGPRRVRPAPSRRSLA